MLDHWKDILILLGLAALIWFVLVKSQLATTPPPTSPPASGATGLVQRIEGIWNHHGQTWKKWMCVCAGIGGTVLAHALGVW